MALNVIAKLPVRVKFPQYRQDLIDREGPFDGKDALIRYVWQDKSCYVEAC